MKYGSSVCRQSKQQLSPAIEKQTVFLGGPKEWMAGKGKTFEWESGQEPG